MARVTDRDEGLVQISAAGVPLEGNLILPQKATGVVLFAHGSGSSRFSSRNRYVAEELRKDEMLGTLLIDLLTHQEELVDTRTAHLRFDIELLANRLIGAAERESRPGRRRWPVGIGSIHGDYYAMLDSERNC